MKERLLEWLRCPRCDGGEAPLALSEAERRNDEIWSGTLACTRAHTFPVREYVADFVEAADPVAARSPVYDTLWDAHVGQVYEGRAAEYERKFQAFANLPGPLEPYFRGKLVLDAGCGEGRFTYLASALGAAHVVAADYSREALRRAWRGTGNPPNVSFIRANIMQLPLAGRFDYVFSLGVLMMTPDARRAFHAVIRALAPGGYVTIFVYGRWTLPLAMWPLRSIGLRMSRARVLRWCNALGFGYDPSVRAVVPIGRALRRLGRLDPLGVGRITYEMLSAPYLSEHSRREVAGWFAEAGVAPISATRMVSASGRLVGRREPRAGA